MANIAFSTPFSKSFTHTDVNVGVTVAEILAPTTNPYEKRVMLIVQNKHATATIQVIFASAGSSGILLMPQQSLSIENYNGPVRAIASAAATPVHLAYSFV